MSLVLYAHPFASYCWKVLIALYENGTAFEYRNIETPGVSEELAALWPMKQFPVLVDDGRTIIETSAIIEHLELRHRGPVRLIPDGDAGTEARMMDCIFDDYVMTPMQNVVANALRPAESRDAYGVENERGKLDTIYAWLDARMTTRRWAAGDAFSIADCAAAPSLFYADWTHEIPAAFEHLRAFRKRLLERPSVARAIDEARPYRAYFPLGAPDRD